MNWIVCLSVVPVCFRHKHLLGVLLSPNQLLQLPQTCKVTDGLVIGSVRCHSLTQVLELRSNSHNSNHSSNHNNTDHPMEWRHRFMTPVGFILLQCNTLRSLFRVSLVLIAFPVAAFSSLSRNRLATGLRLLSQLPP